MSAKEFVDAISNSNNLEAEDAFKRAKRWSRDQAKHWQGWATGYHKEICK